MENYNQDKVDKITLALLYLTTFEEHGFHRAWKSLNWDVLNRLHEKGYIGDAKNKNKSVALTDKGTKLSEKLFREYFQNNCS